MGRKSTEKSKLTKTAWVVIVLLFFLTVISNADKAIIGFASVPIIEELGLNAEQWGLVGSVFFLLYSISAILGGMLADKFGTKVVIAGMVIVWSLVQFSTTFCVKLCFFIDYKNYFGCWGRSILFSSYDSSF